MINVCEKERQISDQASDPPKEKQSDFDIEGFYRGKAEDRLSMWGAV